jgi:hypothetical protein
MIYKFQDNYLLFVFTPKAVNDNTSNAKKSRTGFLDFVPQGVFWAGTKHTLVFVNVAVHYVRKHKHASLLRTLCNGGGDGPNDVN